MRVRTSIIVIVVGLVAVGAAGAISLYPSASDARDVVDRTWEPARSGLETRYEALGSLSRAVRADRPDVELLDIVDDAVEGWKLLIETRSSPDVDHEPTRANQAEAAGARLAQFVTASPSLRANPDVVLALRKYLEADPRVEVEAYNGAVVKYDRSRSRFPGRFFASLLGFDAIDTVEIPGALEDLDVPAPPAETPPPEAHDEEAGPGPADGATPSN